MKKPELIHKLAKVTALTKQESAAIVETVFECITDALVKGDKVEFRGFGSFKVRQRGALMVRNPKEGLIHVPAKTVPHFKPGKRLRSLLNGTAHPVSVP